MIPLHPPSLSLSLSLSHTLSLSHSLSLSLSLSPPSIPPSRLMPHMVRP